MNCKICDSSNIQKINNFKPYLDKEWEFGIFDCLDCHVRFAQRDKTVEYHEELHSAENSPYMAHYVMSEKIKKLLSTNLQKCENILNKKSPVIEKVLSYIKNKNKEISILEIGCSSGYVTAYIQKLGYKNALGIDISSTAIEYASLAFGNFYKLKEDREKYDVIFHTGLIGCVDEPIEFLNYYLELLSENGIMFFNAPDVESVLEVDELWVSTPPPDLIYLFEKNIFKKMLDKRYIVSFTKTLTPMVILRKHINRLKGNKNHVYPRNFYIKHSSYTKPASNFLKQIIVFSVSVLIKLKIIKQYSDDYGIIIKIETK